MIRNYCYLIVGALCLLSAVTHEMNGFTAVFPALSNTSIDAQSWVTFNYLWHIIATENVVMGVALVLIALRKNDTASKYIAQFVMALLVVRWLSIAFSTLSDSLSNVTKILPESIIMWLLVLLLWLGVRKKEKQ
ncbi:hypothetical protein RCZ04_18810 [Capnocytophaga sp. HP1101]